TWFAQRILPFTANAHFGYFATPPAAAGRTLIAEPAYIITLIVAYIAKSRNIKTTRPATVVILIFISFNTATCAAPEMVVHYIVPQFAAAATQSVRPHICCRIHQHPSRIERRGANKNYLSKKLIRFICFSIHNLYTFRFLGILIV